MLLSDEEKKKFSEYCLVQINTGLGMMEQFDKFPDHVMQALTKKEKEKIAAYTFIYNDLNSGESFSI